jgi:hypothetical protein
LSTVPRDFKRNDLKAGCVSSFAGSAPHPLIRIGTGLGKIEVPKPPRPLPALPPDGI